MKRETTTISSSNSQNGVILIEISFQVMTQLTIVNIFSAIIEIAE